MPQSHDLTTLLDQFIAEEFEDRPVMASAAGAAGYDDRLGDFSASARERRASRDREWHATFTGVPDDGLDADARIDRDLAIATLRGRVLLDERPDWRRDPATYLEPCLRGPHVLFLHRLHPEAELVAAAVARLRQVPDVLEAGMANLDPELTPRLLVDRAIGQARSAVRYARDYLPAEAEDPRLRTALTAAAAEAALAFERFAEWLEGLGERAGGDWRLGEPLYSALLAERELLDLDANSLHRRGQAAYDELDIEMRKVAENMPGGGPDWLAVMKELNQEHAPTLEAMRQAYETTTGQARDFLRERKLVPFAEGEECAVVPAPVFQRPVLAVASYAGPPPLTDRRLGHFFVPFTADDASEEQVQQRLQTNSSASIPTISVHEAYPGHHWHRTWSAGGTRPIRKLLGTPYFGEGWALYAERMMYQEGFFTDPRHVLAHLDARIFRAARIVVDTALHAGDMSVEEAVDTMATKASLSRDTAEVEIRRYCAWPTQAASYLTGALEIEAIRERWRAANPAAPLADFHAAIAGSGNLPLGLAGRAVLGDA
ncbi:MAG TPA: DUF885 domain-containing protein [Jatrophihabitantaceae bacterium]